RSLTKWLLGCAISPYVHTPFVFICSRSVFNPIHARISALIHTASSFCMPHMSFLPDGSNLRNRTGTTLLRILTFTSLLRPLLRSAAHSKVAADIHVFTASTTPMVPDGMVAFAVCTAKSTATSPTAKSLATNSLTLDALMFVHGYPGSLRNSMGLMTVGFQWAASGYQ
ncbi:hypothetical protein B0H14DRAFT_3722237, partial [Mycena olivaceomarginata]